MQDGLVRIVDVIVEFYFRDWKDLKGRLVGELKHDGAYGPSLHNVALEIMVPTGRVRSSCSVDVLLASGTTTSAFPISAIRASATLNIRVPAMAAAQQTHAALFIKPPLD